MQTESYKTPKWVKGLGIAALLLVIVVAILMLNGHNPAQHIPSSATETSHTNHQEATEDSAP